jgi:hypothetical protein
MLRVLGLLGDSGAQDAHPHDAIQQVQEPAQIEPQKLPKVALSDANSHPHAVVIKASYTNIAVWTVSCVWRLVRLTDIAPTPAGCARSIGSGGLVRSVVGK